MKRQNITLVLVILLLVIVPLVFVRTDNPEAETFAGSDAQATAAIASLAPEYKPWAAPLWEPPSGEVESLLFALQAAAGAGALAYCIGYYKGLRRGARRHAQGN